MVYNNTELYDLQSQDVTGLECLRDDRYNWRQQRNKTLRLGNLYRMAEYQQYADRADACATWLGFNRLGDHRLLREANFCRLRLCPMCSQRGAWKRARLLSQVMDMVQAEYHCQYIFATFTVQNVTGDKLGAALQQITDGWHRIMMMRPVARAVKGWFRAIEITRNPRNLDQDDPAYGMYHPHIHAIFAVEDGYFRRKSGLYLSHDDLQARWRKACRLDYDPIVGVSRTRGKYRSADDDGGANAAAVLEASKYVTKDSDYISSDLDDEEAVGIVRAYTNALRNRRLTAFGGWLRDVARWIKADDLDNVDLTEDDDGHIRNDLAEVVEYYGWHFGAGDYVLAWREYKMMDDGEDYD